MPLTEQLPIRTNLNLHKSSEP